MKIGLGEYISCGLYLSAAIICAAFLIFRHLKHYRKNKERMVMTFLLWNILLTGLIETVTLILAFLNVENFLIIKKIETFLYFIIHISLSPAFVLYVLLINGAAKNKGFKFYLLLFSEMIIPEVLIIITPFTNLVYYFEIVDGYIVYQRGWAMIILYIVALQYLAYAIVYLVKTWSLLKKSFMAGYQFFLLLILLGIVIQLLTSPIFGVSIEIEALFEGIAIVGLLLTVDCNDSLIDSETKLPNGETYKVNVQLYEKYKYKYTVINLKIDNLDYYEGIISPKAKKELIEYITNTFISISNKGEYYRFDNKTFIVVIPHHVLYDKQIKLIKEFYDKVLVFDNHEISLQLVVSIIKVPIEADTLEEHLKVLDYKPNVDKVVTIVSGEDLKFLKRQSEIDRAIHRAINARSFEVYYQPIWEKDSNSIVACEALCRLEDEVLGKIPPSEFIPIAESTGTIIALGNIVIEKVCQDISELRFMELGIKCVELNLSLYQLRSKDLANHILDNLSKYNIPPSMINLEITESRDFLQVVGVKNFMDELMSKGFTFSLDDYGTAYSNLTNVVSIEYKNIKIDSSILWKSINDFNTRQLLELTIKTFRNFGNNIIQEGVETKEQLDIATNAGANLIQGYYFSKPLPRLEFVKFIKDFIEKSKAL